MHRPDNIVAHTNATRILRFASDGTTIRTYPVKPLNLYCPFIPDEIIVHHPHGIGGFVYCDLFRFQDDGFIGVAKDYLVRTPMRFILPRGTFPPVNGNYNVRFTAENGQEIESTDEAILVLSFEFIRYGTPGQPRE